MAKRVFLVLGLALGLVVIDQSIRLLGNRLVASRYWADNVYPLLDHAEPGAVVLVGDCRPLVLDTALLQRKTGKPVVNLGRSGVGMGHMIFTLELLLERADKKPRIFLFVNDEVLSEASQIRSDLARGRLWWPMLPSDRQLALSREVETPRERIQAMSGLYQYRGRGPELLKAAVRAARHEPFDLKALENPNFVYGRRSLASRLAEFPDQTDPRWEMHPEIFRALEPRLERVKELGLPLTVVVSPMHWKRQSPEAMKKVIAAAHRLASIGDWPVLSYLTDERFLKNDEYWGNPGHLNQLGVAAFSEVFARDVK